MHVMFIIIEVYEILQILRKFVEFLSRKQEAVVGSNPRQTVFRNRELRNNYIHTCKKKI